MRQYSIPYGKSELSFALPENWAVRVLSPARIPTLPDAPRAVKEALDKTLGGFRFEAWRHAGSAAIAINDKTRAIPLGLLLPPLLERLESIGLSPSSIRLLIAAGSHPPMPESEFGKVVPTSVLGRYPVMCHNASASPLTYLGETSRGTPVWIHRAFMDADLRIVVGNIEPHQFAGFSGGSKTAVIGLAGKETITRNHARMGEGGALAGHYTDNPVRQDIEEMGRMAGVHLALNAVVNETKGVVRILAGEPKAVIESGYPLALQLYAVTLSEPLDLAIVSPGGHPKDLNVYQSQKALGHVTPVMRRGGGVILAAACPEGAGSASYEAWMEGMTSYAAVLERFAREPFRIGPHKAFQIARDASQVHLWTVTNMSTELARRLLLNPVASLEQALEEAGRELGPGARVGILPWGNSTIPLLGGKVEESNDSSPSLV